jgi:hypothetical protein
LVARISDLTPRGEQATASGAGVANLLPYIGPRCHRDSFDRGSELETCQSLAFHIDGKRLVIEKADKIPKFTHHDLVKALRKTKKRLVDLLGFREVRRSCR